MTERRTGVRLQDVTVRFRMRTGSEQTVLHRVSVQVSPGQMLAIVGPSGCGKSTLLRLVAGLQSATTGEVVFTDDGNSTVASRPRVGFVFQSANLLPWRNVAANIGLPLELAGANPSSRHSAIDAARQLVGLLDGDVPKLPRQLSGGMQMRVSLARALVTTPQILLLDEPFAALDDILRQQLIDELSTLRQRHHWTTLLVTHNVAEAVCLADRILVLGKVHAGDEPSPQAVVDLPWAAARPADLRSELEFARQCAHIRQLLEEVASE
ncbi:MAG: ATP-binding cassette domain-containing protein [Pirellulales bacterium]